jgi:hypothetical protein
MTIHNALLRPIEITSANNVLTIADNDGIEPDLVLTVPVGVYANIFSLVLGINTVATVPLLYINSYFKVVSALEVAEDNYYFSASALAFLLGYDGTHTVSRAGVAPYRPSHCFIASHQTSDLSQWNTDSGDQFHGAVGTDGNLCGISMSVRESRAIKWPWEPSENVFDSAALLSFESGGSIYWPETSYCFWSVVNGSRTASITNAGSISPKGLYFVPCVDTMLGASPTVDPYALTWDSGGTKFSTTNTSNRDDFVFCSVPEAVGPPTSPDQRLRTYHDVEVTLKTAVAPAWSVGLPV